MKNLLTVVLFLNGQNAQNILFQESRLSEPNEAKVFTEPTDPVRSSSGDSQLQKQAESLFQTDIDDNLSHRYLSEGEDLLYQESRNVSEDEEKILTRQGEQVYTEGAPQQTSNDGESLLYQETRRNDRFDSGNTFTETQNAVFLGSLDDDDICSANSQCSSQCCQEPHMDRRRALSDGDDILYEESRNQDPDADKQLTEPKESTNQNEGDDILYDETRSNPDEQDKAISETYNKVYSGENKEFTEPQDKVYSSQGQRFCVKQQLCKSQSSITEQEYDNQRMKQQKNMKNMRKKGKMFAYFWFFVSILLSFYICYQRYNYRQMLANIGQDRIPTQYQQAQTFTAEKQEEDPYGLQGASATQSASNLGEVMAGLEIQTHPPSQQQLQKQNEIV